MTCNVGKIDRVIRGMIGIASLAWVATSGTSAFEDTNNLIAGAVGGIMLFTAIIGWCPPYAIFSLNTGCKVKK